MPPTFREQLEAAVGAWLERDQATLEKCLGLPLRVYTHKKSPAPTVTLLTPCRYGVATLSLVGSEEDALALRGLVEDKKLESPWPPCRQWWHELSALICEQLAPAKGRPPLR